MPDGTARLPTPAHSRSLLRGPWGLRALSATLVLAMAAGGTAHAETERERQTKACRGDAVRLCAFAIPNEAKITRCMERKKDRLSPACRVYFKGSGKPHPKR